MALYTQDMSFIPSALGDALQGVNSSTENRGPSQDHPSFGRAVFNMFDSDGNGAVSLGLFGTNEGPAKRDFSDRLGDVARPVMDKIGDIKDGVVDMFDGQGQGHNGHEAGRPMLSKVGDMMEQVTGNFTHDNDISKGGPGEL